MILMIHMVQRQNNVNSGDNSGLAFIFLFDCMNPIWCIHLKTSVKKNLKFILTSEVYVRYIVSVLQAFILQCKIWVIEDFFFEQTALVSSFYQAHVCQEIQVNCILIWDFFKWILLILSKLICKYSELTFYVNMFKFNQSN